MGKIGVLDMKVLWGQWCCVLIIVLIPYLSVATQQHQQQHPQFDVEMLGKAAKGRLGNLYHLRNKLVRSPVSAPESKSSSDQHFSTSGRRVLYASPPSSPPSSPTNHFKESRGYSFHHSSADISNPMFAQHGSYSTRDFHSRMGKVSDSSNSKWKNPEKSIDKYIKYAYKIDTNSENGGGAGGGGGGLNSFNIYQLDSNKSNSSPYLKMKGKISNSAASSLSSSSSGISSSSTSTTTTTSSPTAVLPSTVAPPPKTKSSGFSISSAGIDMSPIKAIGQGLNSAMTTVLTQKLMGIIDQEVPQGFLNPLKHLVSSGQRMVEFWDKRANARDGKAPGIVEMFGYGIEQLKKYRDGQPMLPTDPITNITSASKTMIQGMMVVKKLTNRVLGYDTDEQSAAVESRGGYDHGGWGWGHHVSYGGIGGLDPFALLAALAFGAFLLQLLLTLLNTSQRSLDVVDINVPLLMSDYHVPNIMTRMDKIFGTPTIRSRRSLDEDSPFFNSVVDKLEGIYKTYQTVKGNPSCARLYMCRAAIQNSTTDENALFPHLYTLGLGQLSGDMSTVTFMKSVRSRVANGEDVNCESEVTGCEE